MIKGLKGKLGIFVIIGAILALLLGGSALSTYRPGWELSTELLAFRCNNCPVPIGGSPIEGGHKDWYLDKEMAVIRTYEPTVNIEWDPDDPVYGIPDVKASVGDVDERYPKMPYEPLKQHYGNFTYVVDYHEYFFDVQIRTIADVEKGPRDDVLIGSMSWRHETSMPYQSINNAKETWGKKIGKPFDGGLFARFSCLPWGIPDYGNLSGYEFNGYWLGIMNAKVENQASGIVTEDIEVDHKGWVRNIQSVGSQINMYKDDGKLTSAYGSIPWDVDKVLDPDIQNAVIVYLPFNIMAGTSTLFDPWGGVPPLVGEISDCKPVDYYLTYTVRMECLVVKEYEFRDPGTSPNPSPISVPQDYVEIRGAGFWTQYGIWIVIAIIAVVLLLFGLSMFGGIGIYSMVRHFLPF